jgi:O-antigen/teichoic acid export membrane protein
MARRANRGEGLLAKVATLVTQPFVANAGYLLGVDLVASLVGFVFWGLAARLYQPEDVGIASAVLSATVFISGIASFGVGTSLVRFLPDVSAPNRLLNAAFVLNTVASILTGGVFLSGLSLWSPSLIALRQNTFYIVGFLSLVTASTLGTTVRMAFLARRQAFYALLHTCVINVIRLLLVVVFADLGAAGVVGAATIAVVGAVVLSLFGFLPRVEAGYHPRLDFCWSSLVAIIPYSAGNYIAGLLTQTLQMLLPLVILEMLGPVSSGHGYIAWMLGSLLASPGMAVAGSAFAEGSNSPHRLAAILLRAFALGILLTVPGTLILGVAAPWVLLLFGSAYAREAVGLLRWLAAAAPMTVLAGLYFTCLRVQKRVGRLVLLSGFVALVTLGVAIRFMPHLGVAASGIGWFVGNSVVAVVGLGEVFGEMARSRSERAAQDTSGDQGALGTRGTSLLVAAIPCYNEACFIGDVVRQTQTYVDIVAVVDDGSTDGTAEVARVAGAQVIRHPTNTGPGSAARDCLQIGRDVHADVLVTLDGDGQHNPDEIPDVIAPILSGGADLVIGSRFMGRYNNVARYRRFGIGVITFLYNWGASTQITDGQSCFRAYNQRALDVLCITEPGFGFSVETLVQARNAGLRIREVSISCVYHREGHSMNPVIHGVGVALMVVKHRLIPVLNSLLESVSDGPELGARVRS